MVGITFKLPHMTGILRAVSFCGLAYSTVRTPYWRLIGAWRVDRGISECLHYIWMTCIIARRFRIVVIDSGLTLLKGRGICLLHPVPAPLASYCVRLTTICMISHTHKKRSNKTYEHWMENKSKKSVGDGDK